MGVASHLGINLAEYDKRIRTFIPDYEEMLDVAADAVDPAARVVVDLGTGTGALAARVLKQAPRARVVGIDADADMLKVAARRIGPRGTFVADSFLRTAIPRSNAIVTSFALHHVRTRAAKARLFRRLKRALGPRGRFVCVDCLPASQARVARVQHDAWRAHLRQSYTTRETGRLLSAWSHEDVYVPLDVETSLMRRAGFSVEVLWRKGAFAVVLGS